MTRGRLAGVGDNVESTEERYAGLVTLNIQKKEHTAFVNDINGQLCCLEIK